MSHHNHRLVQRYSIFYPQRMGSRIRFSWVCALLIVVPKNNADNTPFKNLSIQKAVLRISSTNYQCVCANIYICMSLYHNVLMIWLVCYYKKTLKDHATQCMTHQFHNIFLFHGECCSAIDLPKVCRISPPPLSYNHN